MNARAHDRWPASMPDYDDICARWHEAVIANHLLKWRAIAAWLKSVSLMYEADAMDDAADSMRTLSEVAHRRALDLQPVRDEEPEWDRDTIIRWNDARDAELIRLYATMSDSQIADVFGCSRYAVKNRINKLGITKSGAHSAARKRHPEKIVIRDDASARTTVEQRDGVIITRHITK